MVTDTRAHGHSFQPGTTFYTALAGLIWQNWPKLAKLAQTVTPCQPWWCHRVSHGGATVSVLVLPCPSWCYRVRYLVPVPKGRVYLTRDGGCTSPVVVDASLEVRKAHSGRLACPVSVWVLTKTTKPPILVVLWFSPPKEVACPHGWVFSCPVSVYGLAVLPNHGGFVPLSIIR